MHTLTDDIESFLHVLGWMTLRYVSALGSYSVLHRGKDMVMFDEHFRQQGHGERGIMLGPSVQGIIRRQLFTLNRRPTL